MTAHGSRGRASTRLEYLVERREMMHVRANYREGLVQRNLLQHQLSRYDLLKELGEVQVCLAPFLVHPRRQRNHPIDGLVVPAPPGALHRHHPPSRTILQASS